MSQPCCSFTVAIVEMVIPASAVRVMNEKLWNPYKTVFVQLGNSELKIQIEAWAADHGFEVFAGSGCDLIGVGYLFALVEIGEVDGNVWSGYLDYLRESDDLTPCIILNSDSKKAEGGISNLRFTSETSITDVPRFLDELLQESFSASKRAEEIWLEKIIQNGQINDLDEFGNTPLVTAVWGKSPVIVQKLIDAGADVHACTDEGVTPLIMLCRRSISGVEEIRGILKGAGVDVNEYGK